MTFELDDLWLEKMQGLTGLSILQKRRLYRIIMVMAVGASYLVDTLLLALFSLSGTIEPVVPLVYAAAALVHITLSTLLHWTGFSDRLKNPHMTLWQMCFAICVQMLGILVCPKLNAFFLAIMFIIFAFGTLRISLKQALVVWLFACLAVTITLSQLSHSSLGILAPTAWEKVLIGIAFATILLRTIGLGYYATSLRMKMYQKTHSLEQAVNYDSLTGVFNRGVILPAVQEHITLFKRKHIVSSIAMVDIDRFKQVNDTYGHPAGDVVLHELASHIRQSIRDTDKIGRYGGEEFIILMPATSLDEALNLVERIRQDIAPMTWDDLSADLRITISAGVTEIHADDDLDELISRADRALYQAKQQGRNRVKTDNEELRIKN